MTTINKYNIAAIIGTIAETLDPWYQGDTVSNAAWKMTVINIHSIAAQSREPVMTPGGLTGTREILYPMQPEK